MIWWWDWRRWYGWLPWHCCYQVYAIMVAFLAGGHASGNTKVTA